MTLVYAMVVIMITWIVIGLSFVGIGLMIRRWFGLRAIDSSVDVAVLLARLCDHSADPANLAFGAAGSVAGDGDDCCAGGCWTAVVQARCVWLGAVRDPSASGSCRVDRPRCRVCC